MGPLYEFHGLSVDCIDKHQPNSPARRKAYQADITFGTNNEFGFDYLRDNMAISPADLVQRSHNYAIVDEVDSVLIDDARTPLIISGPVPKGDDQMFEEYQPLVEKLVDVQRKLATQYLADAKQKISEGREKNDQKLMDEALPVTLSLTQSPAQEQAADKVSLRGRHKGRYAQDRRDIHGEQQPPYAGSRGTALLRR